MKTEFQYRILVVDNETPKGFSLRCPETGVCINTTVFNTIDAALEDMGVPGEYLAPAITAFQGRIQHDYDIVLLDFQMDENNIGAHMHGGKQELPTKHNAAHDFDYPMGALTLLPLYKLSFDVTRKGRCVVQGYSQVIWDMCPKAAAVFHLVNDFNSNGENIALRIGNVSGIPIGPLIEKRARSILREIPADYLQELYDLLDAPDDAFWNFNRERIAAWLDCQRFTMRHCRPDLVDTSNAKGWLRQVLSVRGFAHEARRCWHTQIVNKVGHRANLSGAEINSPAMQPLSWPREDGLLEIGGETFRVCDELLADLRSFPPLNSFIIQIERTKRMHELFRMSLKGSDCSGYSIDRVLNELKVDIQISRNGDAWATDCYVWIHRKVIASLLKEFLEVPRSNGDVHLIIHASKDRKGLYLIAGQSVDISRTDVEKVFLKASGATLSIPWGPFPRLNDWGRIELWGSNGLFEVTSHTLRELDKTSTVAKELTLSIGGGAALSAVVMVLPLDTGEFQ